MARELDLVLFGATGFTGRLVAEVLQRRVHETGGALRWALAGRDGSRIDAVARALGLPGSVAQLVADASDPAAMAALAKRTRAVLTTVGPYQRHGTPLVEACADAGTDYLDLCGEPLWMARMIEALQPRAAASGARIVFSCGVDSIPFDLGAVYLQNEMEQRFGAPAAEVRALVRVFKGAASGGTVASLLATVEAMVAEPALRRTMRDPFALVARHPGFKGPRQPALGGAEFDDWAQAWSGPFVMAPINTKNVHRTHALRGHPWGAGFVYSERQQTGTGAEGERRAKALARRDQLTNLLLAVKPTRALLARFVLPKPGEGPDARARERGKYEVAITGQTADGQRLTAVVKGQGDPGYGSTSRLIAEAALCLLEDTDRQATPGGVWTPGAAMGLKLARRLHAHAGLTFDVQEAAP